MVKVARTITIGGTESLGHHLCPFFLRNGQVQATFAAGAGGVGFDVYYLEVFLGFEVD
ncbi:MAG: hypothetical protein HY998_03935 [candidate division NC10 bacterium]|nr:hypothetical protein [candidate division NC10 bacterium]